MPRAYKTARKDRPVAARRAAHKSVPKRSSVPEEYRLRSSEWIPGHTTLDSDLSIDTILWMRRRNLKLPQIESFVRTVDAPLENSSDQYIPAPHQNPERSPAVINLETDTDQSPEDSEPLGSFCYSNRGNSSIRPRMQIATRGLRNTIHDDGYVSTDSESDLFNPHNRHAKQTSHRVLHSGEGNSSTGSRISSMRATTITRVFPSNANRVRGVSTQKQPQAESACDLALGMRKDIEQLKEFVTTQIRQQSRDFNTLGRVVLARLEKNGSINLQPRQPAQDQTGSSATLSTQRLMSSNVSTIPDLFAEFTTGLAGGPAVENLEHEHRSMRRRNEINSWRYYRSLAIVNKVQALAHAQNIPIEDAVNKMEQWRLLNNESLSWVVGNLQNFNGL